MKTSFNTQKTDIGYSLEIIGKRLLYLKAFITGKLVINIDKTQASAISNALYTPKPYTRKKTANSSASDK